MNKILITSNEFGHHGGIVNYFRILFRRFRNESIELVHHTVGSRMKDFHRPVKRAIIYPWRYFRDISRLIWRLATDQQIKIVHVNPSLIPLALIREAVIIVIAKLFRRRVIVFIQGWKEPYMTKLKTNRLAMCAFKLTYAPADVILVLAQRFSDSLQEIGIPKDKIHITKTMFEGELIEIKQRRKHSGDVVRFLYLSRISELKGIYELIEAVNILKEHRSRFLVTVAGHGVNVDTVSSIKADIGRLGISDCFEFKGHLEGVEKFKAYSSADVYVFPSWHEGCPTSVLEALASGLFVISTDVGALREIIRDGVNGRIIKAKDASDLAGKMDWAIRNIGRVRKLGDRNRTYAFENYESLKIIRQIEDIYKDVLASVA
ncbi:MAG: glycosyltransferase [Planctomycetota bacterium]|nr:glycosyltransferase [Planctomycetota bacterium]